MAVISESGENRTRQFLAEIKAATAAAPDRSIALLAEYLDQAGPVDFAGLTPLIEDLVNSDHGRALRRALGGLGPRHVRALLAKAILLTAMSDIPRAAANLARARRLDPALLRREAPMALAAILPIPLSAWLEGDPWAARPPRFTRATLLAEGRADPGLFFEAEGRAEELAIVLERSNAQIVEEVHARLGQFDPPRPYRLDELNRDFGHLLLAEINRASDISGRLADAVFEDLDRQIPDDSLADLFSHYREPITLAIDDQIFGSLRRLEGLRRAAIAGQAPVVLVFDRGLTFNILLASLRRSLPPEQIWVSMPAANARSRDRFIADLKADSGPSQISGAAYAVDWGDPVQTDAVANAGEWRVRPGCAVLLAPFGERKYGPIARSLALEALTRRDLLLFDAAATAVSQAELNDIIAGLPADAVVDRVSFADLRDGDRPPAARASVELTAFGDLLAEVSEVFGLSPRKLESFLRPVVGRMLASNLAPLLALAHGAERTLRETGAAYALVMSSRLPQILTVLRAARRVGVPTLEPQAVLYGRGVARQLAPAGDHVWAIDQYAVRLFRDHYGVEPDRLILGGSTRIDDFKRQFDALDPVDCKAWLEQRTGPLDRAILYCTQPLPLQTNLAGLGSLIAAARDVPGTVVVIKPHPTESESSVRAYMRAIAELGAEAICYLTREDDTYQLMRASALVVTMTSNVALEAAVFGVPAMVLDVGDTGSPVDFERMGAAAAVRSFDAVPDVVRDLLTGGAEAERLAAMQAQMRADNPQLLDGATAQRIVSYAEGLGASGVRPEGGAAPESAAEASATQGGSGPSSPGPKERAMDSTVVYTGPDNLIEMVEADGCFVIRNFFDRAAVIAAREEVEKILDADEARRAADPRMRPIDQSTPLRSIKTPLMHTMWFMTVRSPAFRRLVNDAFASPVIQSLLRDLAGSVRLRIDLARRSSGANDRVDDFQLPHEWHRDTPGEFTFGLFLDDVTEPDSGGTIAIKGSHWDACDPRWDLMLGEGANKSRKEFLTDKLRKDIPASESARAVLNAEVRESVRDRRFEMLGEMGDLYFFLNECWHGRAPNTTGKRFMLARIGGFATDFPFKDDIPLPPEIDTLPEPLRGLYGRDPEPNTNPETLMRRLYASPRIVDLSQRARLEKDGIVEEFLAQQQAAEAG